MNFQDQIRSFREKKQNDFINHINKTKLDQQKQLDKQKKINILAKLSLKYKHVFNPTSIEKAVWTIQKFIKKHYFEPKCMNDERIPDIPPLYRIRITFTKKHIINSQSHTYTKVKSKQNTFMFKYCFDIRDLYPIKNNTIKLENVKYILLPHDHNHIESIWNKINGTTNKSIQYINMLDYCESLSHDKDFGYKSITSEENIDRIKNVLDEVADNDNNNDTNNDDYIVVVAGIKLDLLFLHQLNKKYFGLV